MKLLSLSIAVLLICADLGFGLKCYFGDQDALGDVKETWDGKPLMSCTKNTTTNLGSVQIERGGLTFKKDDECDEYGHIKVCYCSKDECNTAHGSARLLVPLLALPALIIRFL